MYIYRIAQNRIEHCILCITVPYVYTLPFHHVYFTGGLTPPQGWPIYIFVMDEHDM